MDYYTRTAKAARSLQEWINNEKRDSWSAFCRKTRLTIGISPKTLHKILCEDYTMFCIVDDKLNTIPKKRVKKQ